MLKRAHRSRHRLADEHECGGGGVQSYSVRVARGPVLLTGVLHNCSELITCTHWVVLRRQQRGRAGVKGALIAKVKDRRSQV